MTEERTYTPAELKTRKSSSFRKGLFVGVVAAAATALVLKKTAKVNAVDSLERGYDKVATVVKAKAKSISDKRRG